MSLNNFEWNFLVYLPDNFSFVKSAFSFEPFHSVVESLIVLGVYAVAAVVLPWIMSLLLAPFGFALMLLGAIGIGIGVYQYLSQNENSVDLFNNRTNSGLVLFALGGLLSFASVWAPLIIAAVAGFRLFNSIPTEYFQPIYNCATQISEQASNSLNFF